MIACPSCGAEAQAGQRFCGHCGGPLACACPSCGTENPPDHRFCGSCGNALGDAAAPTAAATVSERRLVTVLFADLVGFTTLSEHRDPEELRELLSGYFDRCRALIERYGGIVEKFIGDAVMAVWGTPVAREDDAERAVRAALGLVQAVAALGEEVGMPGLRVRAGVLTGNAAVEVGADGEGMILGDTVNTASRLQTLAEPGTVLVDDVTRRASEAAVAYEDAGTHQVKGREQPIHAYVALRVVAGSGGARRGAGLEAPLVGRARELQTIVEAGERSAAEGRAGHVSVIGDAGSGKSRLLWEYFKYLDGISDVRWWHQGRCLSYGEGVAYWALAEMLRSRAGILEEEAPETARTKLRAIVEELVPEERERRLVEPRLAHLLRLEDRPDADRADLFSGWRLFFERMAETDPVILAFEDMQWADSGLLDFIDYLLDWSADHPIFVLTAGRPELRDRRPSWEPLALPALTETEIVELLERLVPGLPEDLVGEIARRSEGIPLYAVETIRMLQDLDVPETLHALVASRLDGLTAGERSLLQDAAVLGQSFNATGAAALSGRPESEVAEVLDGLVAKQILAHEDDPRSPERGQYVFLQALLRTVAYGTLSRRARKARHVAAAQHLEATWPGDVHDIAEVLASHYLEAIRADPEADDVAELRGSARETLTAAGRASASLALGAEADRYFAQAADLAEDDDERGALFEQAGRALRQSDLRAAEERLRQAMALYERSGRPSGGSAAVALSEVLRFDGRVDEARELLEPFRAADVPGTDPIVRARALAALGTTLTFAGQADSAGPLYDEALTTLEVEQEWTALADALMSRAVWLIYQHRLQEGLAVLRHTLTLAREHDVPAVALRAHYNIVAVALESDRYGDAIDAANDVLALARERGERLWESEALAQLVVPLVGLGRWDETMEIADRLLRGQSVPAQMQTAVFVSVIAAARGDDGLLARCLELAAPHRESKHIDSRVAATLVIARDAVDQSPDEALRLVWSVLTGPTTAAEFRTEAYALAIEAAFALQGEATMSELVAYVDALPPAGATPILRAGRARLGAESAHRRGDADAAARCELEAIALLRSVGARPLLARALAERGMRRADEEALAEARAIYTQLGAERLLAHLGEASGIVAQI